ncbi:MAG TPA: hypothetical protein VHA30_03145 [Patescibacteria group bacterium]|nr:hypothetical protein [Patescibacteria group bacterium]
MLDQSNQTNYVSAEEVADFRNFTPQPLAAFNKQPPANSAAPVIKRVHVWLALAFLLILFGLLSFLIFHTGTKPASLPPNFGRPAVDSGPAGTNSRPKP